MSTNGASHNKGSAESNLQEVGLDNIRHRTENQIRRFVQDTGTYLVESPIAAGKTTGALKVISEEDGLFTYLAERMDLYDQAEKLSHEFGVDATIIPSPHRACHSFDEDSPHFDPMAQTFYEMGIPAGRLHDVLNLSCPDDCTFQQFWRDFDPDEHDILVGNHQHAYISSVVDGRTVLIDEFPGGAFEQEFKDAPEMLGRFLQATDGLPFDDWDDLIMADYGDRDAAYEWFAEHGLTVDAETIVDTNETARYHSKSPFLVWAVLESHKGDNGYSLPWFNLESSETISAAFGELENNRRVAIDHERREIHVLTQPDLRGATGVIGLDGTPFPFQWELATGEDFEHWQLVEPGDEMNDYISNILRVTVKQTSEYLKSYHGDWLAPHRDEGVLYGVEVAEGQKPVVISTKKALKEYREAGILDRAKRSMNYGQVPSSNDFKGEPLGTLLGAPHPGNSELKKWAAYFGAHIDGEGQGMAKTYGEFGDRIYEHFVHNQVLQAILRFGRGENGATVYVETAAMPEWLDVEPVTVERFVTENKRDVADHLRDAGTEGMTKDDLVEQTGISERTVRRRLKDFSDAGLVEVEDNPGPYPTTWRWSP